jgi:hypothetical protein
MKINLMNRGILALKAIVLPVILLVSAQTGQSKYREYAWKANGSDHRLGVNIPDEIYEHYKAIPRTYNYSSYILEDEEFTTVPAVAEALANKGRSLGYSEWQTINLIIAFVQYFEYRTEIGEYPRYPAETLAEGGGDCEDTAILLAAMFKHLGYDCILLSPEGHMSVGLHVTGFHGQYYPYQDKTYYYVETTGKNWKLGEIPSTYSGYAEIYRLPNPDPQAQPLAFDETAPNLETDGKLYVSFYRSPRTDKASYQNKNSYEYTLRLEGDPDKLNKVKSVKYQRMHSTFAEYNSNTWIVKNVRSENFASSWTGWGSAPIRVKIIFNDGNEQELLIDEAPKLATR